MERIRPASTSALPFLVIGAIVVFAAVAGVVIYNRTTTGARTSEDLRSKDANLKKDLERISQARALRERRGEYSDEEWRVVIKREGFEICKFCNAVGQVSGATCSGCDGACFK